MAEIYLEGTTSSSLVWTFHSMAVKSAYQLGLHSISSSTLSEVDREIRRRLWYWCVMNDRYPLSKLCIKRDSLQYYRLLSVTYGRPPLIPLSHVKREACSSLAFSKMPQGVLSSSLAYFNALMYVGISFIVSYMLTTVPL